MKIIKCEKCELEMRANNMWRHVKVCGRPPVQRAPHGGYRENAGRTKKHHVPDSFGTTVCLQSTHELAVADWLNASNIKWKREGCFFYGSRRYFPDFHLVESDIYLDVKNEYLIKVDAEKIRQVCEQNPTVTLHVFTLKELLSGSQSVQLW